MGATPLRAGALPGVALLAALSACSGTVPAGSGPTGAGHAAHLRDQVVAAQMDCAACHAPTAFAVDFSQNPLVASHGGTFDKASGTCSNVYCHGNFAFGAVRGSHAAPTWTDPTPLGCASCHGMPPDGHPALSGTVTAATCSACHPQSIDPTGHVPPGGGTHLDGLPQTAGAGCTGCHGDATRTGILPGTDVNLPSAPPRAPDAAPAYATGAHLGHANPTAASALMAPIACAECHPVPTDSAHAVNPPPQVVVFGPLSTTGGASPAWTPGTAGCAATYCHGNFAFDGVKGASAAPTWTDTTPLTCVSCHAMPPTGHPTYSGAQDAPGCASCHPQSVNPDGTILAGGGHLNGKADGGGCAGCHGLPPSTGRHLQEDHARLQCDGCHPTGYTSTVAIAPFHRNGVVDLGAQAGYSCGLTGCPSGTVGTCTNRCHTQPQRW